MAATSAVLDPAEVGPGLLALGEGRGWRPRPAAPSARPARAPRCGWARRGSCAPALLDGAQQPAALGRLDVLEPSKISGRSSSALISAASAITSRSPMSRTCSATSGRLSAVAISVSASGPASTIGSRGGRARSALISETASSRPGAWAGIGTIRSRVGCADSSIRPPSSAAASRSAIFTGRSASGVCASPSSFSAPRCRRRPLRSNALITSADVRPSPSSNWPTSRGDGSLRVTSSCR